MRRGSSSAATVLAAVVWALTLPTAKGGVFSISKAKHSAVFRARTHLSSRRTSKVVDDLVASSLLLLRGGSTAVLQDDEKQKEKEKLHKYRLQQQLYLQSRSLQIRQALIQRGLDEFQHSVSDASAGPIETDWDCALATAEHPKSCLYSFDAEEGSKVLMPVNVTSQSITLSSLNRLRRNDPTKVEPLWHNKYRVLSTWLSPNHKYSVYTHLDLVGTILSYLLDTPVILGLAMGFTFVVGFLLTLPVWEGLFQIFLTSPLLWRYWPQWGRFAHAALPLKLLMAQMSFKYVSQFFGKIYGSIRSRLVEWECRILEDCIPLTILEGVDEEDDEDEFESFIDSEESDDSDYEKARS